MPTGHILGGVQERVGYAGVEHRSDVWLGLQIISRKRSRLDQRQSECCGCSEEEGGLVSGRMEKPLF